MQKQNCSCSRVDRHLPGCPFKNQTTRIDFSALLKLLKQIEKDHSDSKKSKKRKRIYVGKVIVSGKKPSKNRNR